MTTRPIVTTLHFMAIIEYVRYRVEPNLHEAFLAGYRAAEDSLAASPHSLSYELSQCQEEPDRFILRIEWDSLDGHMNGFRKSDAFKSFFQAVKPFVGALEEMQHYEPSAVAGPNSICDAVGGVVAFFRLAKEMHSRMKSDDLLGPMFSHSPPSHVPHLAMWMCEVFGGPRLWTETLGDIGPMLSKHANLDIPEEKRARFAEIAHQAATQCLPADQPEAIETIARYFDWGTQIAVENSKPGHVADPAAGVPTWSWDA